MGALVYNEDSNLFDDIFFYKGTPLILIIAVFAYSSKFYLTEVFCIVFVILPVVIRSSLLAKYFIYIGGMCEVPSNYFIGMILPWILGAVINHMQIFAYLINWTALVTNLYV